MIQLLELAKVNDLTPNQISILFCIRNELDLPEWNTLQPDLRKLNLDGWVKDSKITSEGTALIDSMDLEGEVATLKFKNKEFREYIVEFNSLFPRIKFPSGVSARSSLAQLEPRFKWFFENYSYTWETILSTTAKYLAEREMSNWDKTTCAKYLVKKRKDGIDESLLAELCELYLNGEDHEPKFFSEKVF